MLELGLEGTNEFARLHDLDFAQELYRTNSPSAVEDKDGFNLTGE